MRIVLLGPPGAGKGTQAQLISKRLRIPHISTGDILREAIKNKKPVGLEAKAYMEKGELVPDEVMNEIITSRLKESDGRGGFILDGYPRTEAQALKLDEALSQMGEKIDFVFYLETSTKVIIERLSGRRICKDCQAVYHVKNMPPHKVDVCDRCGGPLYQRPDDREETIKNRLEIYIQQTKPLIDYYQKQGKLTKADGDLAAERLFEGLLKIFAKRKVG